MPLVRFDLYEGRSEKELKKLLDTAHTVLVEVFKVPVRDRYQIVNEHQPPRMLMEDAGLNIPRTKAFVMMQITTRPRTREVKVKFYKRMAEELEKQCGIAQSDIMINIVTCTEEDWSLGLGRAQLLTGRSEGQRFRVLRAVLLRRGAAVGRSSRHGAVMLITAFRYGPAENQLRTSRGMGVR